MTDQTKRVIYRTENGGVAVIVPSPNCELTIHQVAQKDVPTGVPYKIVDVADVPSDRTFREAWEADIANIADGVGL